MEINRRPTNHRPAEPGSDAFADLIEAHKRILYKVANAYCRNPDDRPDLIQEMVIQLWLSYPRFDGRSRFSTWMYRVAMNVAISFYRSERRRIRDALPLDDLQVEVGITDPDLDSLADDMRELQQMIAGLSDLNRALVILYLDGYSQAEIGTIVGISPANVATRINRIKTQLQGQGPASLSAPQKEDQDDAR